MLKKNLIAPLTSFLFTLFLLPIGTALATANNPEITDKDNPLSLEFHRLAVRRFIFSNNINLCEFVPSEIVSFKSMHPSFSLSHNNKAQQDTLFTPILDKGRLHLNKKCNAPQTSIYIGGVNPYATYEIDIESITYENKPIEIGIEFARLGLRDRIQVIAIRKETNTQFAIRRYKEGKIIKVDDLGTHSITGPFILRTQLYGRSLGVFIAQHQETHYIGHINYNDHFGDVLDLRKSSIAKNSTFNIVSNLEGEVVINKASSYLSPGIGQADIRLISYEDLSPYLEDNRLWFTFSCRGMHTSQSVQGVLSLDPSVFDVQFEGMIVFDHEDGLIRNDYASHLFYDRQTKEWRAYACDFGGSANIEGRTGSGLVTAYSIKDPRRGFSVMKATRVENNQVEGHNEDPCIYYNKEDNKWHLLTSAFVDGNITSRTYVSDSWNGKFTPITPPIQTNSTGTSIQKVGNTHYAFMGGHGNLRVHSYPELQELGELNLDLQPHWPKPAGRIWASLVPLPNGYPYKYILLTMDRPNFPGIKEKNWTYGALYFFGSY